MKKNLILSILLVLGLACASGQSSFVRLNGVEINGFEEWEPDSNIFVFERAFKIPGFYICDHEVTRGEWKKVMGSYPGEESDKVFYPEYDSFHDNGKSEFYDKRGRKLSVAEADNNPADNLSWVDAVFYCNARSIQEGLTPCYTMYFNKGEGLENSKNPDEWVSACHEFDVLKSFMYFICDFDADGYRLPTEAEWLWAYRGREKYLYAGSDDLYEVAWVSGNSKGTRVVKSKKPNGFGLYDMAGNVSEYTWDATEAYGSSLHLPFKNDTPFTGETGNSSDGYEAHVYRGFSYAESEERSATKESAARGRGFRVVRTDKKCRTYEPADSSAVGIRYESSQDYVPKTKKVKKGYVLTKEDLPELSARGWTFLGWNKSPGDKITEITKITAKWRKGDPDYSITYSYEREPGAPAVKLPSSKELVLGSALTAADLPEYKVNGYKFYWTKGIGNLITKPVKIFLYCVKNGEIIGSKATPDAVGDIVFADGSAVSCSDTKKLTQKQKDLAIAVIFDVNRKGNKWGIALEPSEDKLSYPVHSLFPEELGNRNDADLVNSIYQKKYRNDSSWRPDKNRAWLYAWLYRNGYKTYNSGWILPSYNMFKVMNSNIESLKVALNKIDVKESQILDSIFCTSLIRPYGTILTTIYSPIEIFESYSKVLPVRDFSGREKFQEPKIKIVSHTNRGYDESTVTVKEVPVGYVVTEEDLPLVPPFEYKKFAGWVYDASRTGMDKQEILKVMKPGTAIYNDVFLYAEYEGSVLEYLGIKAPSEKKEFGDIVFTDGSATPLITLLKRGDERKPVYKDAKGRKYGMNPDLRTLSLVSEDVLNNMVGVVFYAGNGKLGKKTLICGIATVSSPFAEGNAENDCFVDGIPVDDKDGSDNFEQIRKALIANGKADDTGNESAYNAFYKAKNYTSIDYSEYLTEFSESLKNTKNSRYKDGWYIPTIEEWKELYKLRLIFSQFGRYTTGFYLNKMNASYITSVPKGSDYYYKVVVYGNDFDAEEFDRIFDEELWVEDVPFRRFPNAVMFIRKIE